MVRAIRLMLLCFAGVILFCNGTVSASPYFAIDTPLEWEEALNQPDWGVKPMMPHDWDDYMGQWEFHLEEGEPYPNNTFIPAELYVWGGDGNEDGGTGEGLVMAWGPAEGDPDNSYSSAWEYTYGEDPDLSNCTISITVNAPQFSPQNGNQINAVSFGMKDMFGLIRSWQWAVGAVGSGTPIEWGVPITITINTAIPGVAAANPVASGYANNPGFDLTMVLVFIVDENATWTGGSQNVPPPGTTIQKPWNMWDNLSVTRHPSNPIVVGTNIDVHMDIPGAVANDFHIEGRIESGLPDGNWGNPPVLVQHVDGPFPNFNITITPDMSDAAIQNWYNITADWSGADVQYCTVIHLGLKFEVTCHNIIVDLVGWWTNDGVKLQNGFNGGHVPILGFDVQDGIGDLAQSGPQLIQLRNGNGDGIPQEGEIPMEIVQMDLVGLTPIELGQLGPDPFGELRVGGRQEQLPWVPVETLDPTGKQAPIGFNNPQPMFPDSFFDVFFEIEVPDVPPEVGRAAGPVILNAGDFLLARQLVIFVGNDGSEELRWFFEIHEAHQENRDLGDAPDSTNNHGAAVQMLAYPSGVMANYPTVYQIGGVPVAPCGPIHFQPTAMAHLGRNVTGEQEADIGWDMDPTNNIIPPTDTPDKDFADDGVLGLPFTLTSCQLMNFQYLVNVINPNARMYVNVWFDFNRDGDWDDKFLCPPNNIGADEWAVQNQTIVGLPVGLNTVTSLSFRPYLPLHVQEDDPIWMRITISDVQFPTLGWYPGLLGDGGSGPVNGYLYGETEDYIFNPNKTCNRSPDITCDGFVNMFDLAKMAASWLQPAP